ncbi:hypothetical protein [Streptomyces gilvosporeus]|uniref:hypothetical protein n=1 Tax=Streptomyces gilvosporeus TaxID=553510 RepID=UPI001F16DC62|nr:hypothetical protein [Streptomyces gilvosporeus]
MGAARVRDVVRDVVAEVAAEELPVVDVLAGFDDTTVLQRLRRRSRRREPLGFGLDEVAVLVTPVVWLGVDQAAKRIADSAVDGASKGAKAVLRKVLRRPTASVVVPPLTPAQLGEVRRAVLEMAAQRGLAQEQAVTVADAVVARLAVPDDDPQDLGEGTSPAGEA